MAVDKAQWQAWKKRKSFSGFLIDLNNGDPRFEARAVKIFSGLGHPGLLDEIRLLAKNAGLPETPLVLIHTRGDSGGGAAIKFYEQNALVIDKGLLKQKNPEELKGTIGHELAHMVLGHTTKTGWLLRAYQKIAYRFAVAKHPVLRALLEPATLILNWKQRRAETQADKKGAVIAGSVDGMISDYSEYLPPKQATPLSFSGIANRIKNSGIVRRIKSIRYGHPTDEKRIKDLKRFAVSHAGEIQASKSRLDDLRGQMGGDFKRVAQHSAGAEPSMPVAGVSSTASAKGVRL